LGVFVCEKSDAESVVFRHEGEDDHTVTIAAGLSGALGQGAFAPVPQEYQDRAQAGKRYYVSLALTEAGSPTQVAVAVAAFTANAEAGLVPIDSPSASPQRVADVVPEPEETSEPVDEAPAPSEPAPLPAWAVKPDAARLDPEATSTAVNVTE
jgi:hypothetical protein